MPNDTQNDNFLPVTGLRWLFFDLNSYFASVEQQDRPELRDRPIVVVPSDTDATCAIAASYEAKAFGIKTGTKIYEAKKMCPDLVCVLARHDKYVEYHHRIFNEVENHIHVSKVCSVDEAACRLYDNEQSTEAASDIARRIKAGLRANIGDYVRCSIGVAPNIFLAKTATDMKKPDGLVILHPHNFRERIFQLGLRDLCGIGANIEARLGRAGVNTVEQFWNLNPKHARKIWGSVAGERFWYKLRGFDVPDKATEKSVVGHSRVLDLEYRPCDKAHGVALNLTVQACARLRRSALYARRFSLSVGLVDRSYWADDMTFSPSQDSFMITSAFNDMWARMQRDTAGAKLLKVSVSLSDLFEPQDTTLDLFAEQGAEKKRGSDELSVAMDVLNKRFGVGAVSLGVRTKTSSGYVGTKIAFTRIPEKAEFNE
jgi:DNA polymerase-4